MVPVQTPLVDTDVSVLQSGLGKYVKLVSPLNKFLTEVRTLKGKDSVKETKLADSVMEYVHDQ